jgi:hypothetical protein
MKHDMNQDGCNCEKLPAYVGTKIVNAKPMHENEWVKGKNCETGNRDGYMVVYEDGYTSWSPKEVFERCYRPITAQEKRMV